MSDNNFSLDEDAIGSTEDAVENVARPFDHSAILEPLRPLAEIFSPTLTTVRLGIESTKMRLVARAAQEYLVDPILPTGRIHSIAGPSGSGKTSFLLHMIRDWSQGKPILGFASRPQPYIYLSCDRSLAETDETLQRLGMGDFNLPIHTPRSIGKEFDNNNPSLFEIVSLFPCKVFFVEAMNYYASSGKNSTDYTEQLKFWGELADFLSRHNITIIGTTHFSKAREGNGVINPRERVIGSVAQGVAQSTLMQLEPTNMKDVTCQHRKLTVSSRNSKTLVFYFVLDGNGILVPSDNENGEIGLNSSSNKSSKSDEFADYRLDAYLYATITSAIDSNPNCHLPFDWTWKPDQVTICADKECSQATFYRWLQKKVDRKEIFKLQKGEYRPTEILTKELEANIEISRNSGL